MRDLIITENITLDGVIEAADNWFGAAGTGDADQSDMIAAITEQRGPPTRSSPAASRSSRCAPTGRSGPATRPA